MEALIRKLFGNDRKNMLYVVVMIVVLGGVIYSNINPSAHGGRAFRREGECKSAILKYWWSLNSMRLNRDGSETMAYLRKLPPCMGVNPKMEYSQKGNMGSIIVTMALMI